MFGDKVSIYMQETETDDFRFELRKTETQPAKRAYCSENNYKVIDLNRILKK